MNPGLRYGPGIIVRAGSRGFSLLELMIVCSLVAVLLSLAVPGYRHYLQRAYRSTAIEALLAAAECQERIYASEMSYDTRRCLTFNDEEKYRLRFEPAEAAASRVFIVIAEPVAGQREDPCGSLSLDQSGHRSISGPAERLRRCWEGR